MSVDTCSHGYPSPLSCVDCMMDEGVGAAPAEVVEVEATALARFVADCPVCDEQIRPGQIIDRLSTGRWVHSRCSPSAPT